MWSKKHCAFFSNSKLKKKNQSEWKNLINQLPTFQKVEWMKPIKYLTFELCSLYVEPHVPLFRFSQLVMASQADPHPTQPPSVPSAFWSNFWISSYQFICKYFIFSLMYLCNSDWRYLALQLNAQLKTRQDVHFHHLNSTPYWRFQLGQLAR